ncbi:unnamed protein product [Arctogadus glacialis]
MIQLSSPMICPILYTTTIRSNGGRRGWWRRVEVSGAGCGGVGCSRPWFTPGRGAAGPASSPPAEPGPAATHSCS